MTDLVFALMTALLGLILLFTVMFRDQQAVRSWSCEKGEIVQVNGKLYRCKPVKEDHGN